MAHLGISSLIRRTLFLGGILYLILVVGWVRSFRYVDWLYGRVGQTWIGVISGGGKLCIFEANATRWNTNGGSRFIAGTAWLYPWPESSGLSDSWFAWDNFGLVRHNFG